MGLHKGYKPTEEQILGWKLGGIKRKGLAPFNKGKTKKDIPSLARPNNGNGTTKRSLLVKKFKKESYSYQNMIKRCYCTYDSSYPRYGGRGITVCDRWLEKGGKGFEHFISDLGKKPENTSIDRIDNDGNYTPTNCRWSTPQEQSRNKSK